MTNNTLVLHPEFKQQRNLTRTSEACLEEAVGLAQAIALEVVQAVIVGISTPKPATLMGSGKVEELAELVRAHEVTLVVVNTALTPVQQRNLEKGFGCKVIDRTALILEIFGARARTYEGKLQVEYAALNYQKSRLVRSWTHLERQRGGFGFLGGPGESQIEIDRRLIRDRMAKIRRQLDAVARTRTLHRKERSKVPYPIVALVGYTNAGKSTLFNRLTGASVLAEDALFATLDPTMRLLKLRGGIKIMISDTVGFVSDLPTELIAAFRATLEEVLEADVLVHVRDVAHPESEAQKLDVEQVLGQLFGKDKPLEQLIEVANKMDLLDAEHKDALESRGAIAISALTGEGVEALTARITEKLGGYREHQFRIHAGDGRALAWLHAHGKVLEAKAEEDYIVLKVELQGDDAQHFTQAFVVR